ncbi:DsbE family thiol:disulfide interchange protein [Herminiimonas contaminans]|uniref:DsbE family thiol:disulfide interchange protein n=1 Tax=Herminiimonas contaminans TaxID=1111140 RepID=A0ABS0EVA4_9BURK|nr:DsbE family thiol:disulfide interchange protein [Herminiimonas contaminans]MBF8178770.1 DsbE family thiol:disulfide interchange protein [Herminiimonas contaminans]
MRYILPLVAFLILAVVLGLGLQRDPRALPSALLDRPAPMIELPLLNEAQRQFDSSKLQGQVWLLNVWASWCGPCREELPALKVLASRDQVPLYGLNYKDDTEEARLLLQQVGNPYLASAVDSKGRVGMDYGVQGVPETFVIDAGGRIRYRHVGPVTAEVWREKLLPLVRSLQ